MIATGGGVMPAPCATIVSRARAPSAWALARTGYLHCFFPLLQLPEQHWLFAVHVPPLGTQLRHPSLASSQVCPARQGLVPG